MAYGLFGKVPQKRDFMSLNMPSAVLTPFETWLQAAVAASRNELGRTWQDHYLVAPIWRFWIGDLILGTTVAGALMSSVDQVGRYFPLSIMYFTEPGETVPPPLLAPLDPWYGAIEQRLLRALSEETDGYLGSILQGLEPPREADLAPLVPIAAPPIVEPEPAVVVATAIPETETASDADGAPVTLADEPLPVPEPPRPAIDELPDTSPFDDLPPDAAPPPAPGGVPSIAFKGGQTLEVPPGETLAGSLVALRDADYRHASGGRSYFWCAASRLGPARVHGRQGLPDPYFFSRMILWERGPS